MDRTDHARRQALIELNAEGLDGGAIGRALGISRQRVHQLRKELGLASPIDARRRRVAQLIHEGQSCAQIARLLQVSLDNITNDARQLGMLEQLRQNRRMARPEPAEARPAAG